MRGRDSSEAEGGPFLWRKGKGAEGKRERGMERQRGEKGMEAYKTLLTKILHRCHGRALHHRLCPKAPHHLLEENEISVVG